jgi:hypothetical protein
MIPSPPLILVDDPNKPLYWSFGHHSVDEFLGAIHDYLVAIDAVDPDDCGFHPSWVEYLTVQVSEGPDGAVWHACPPDAPGAWPVTALYYR